jgi:hypothetical protein
LNANAQSTHHTPATNPTIIINRIDLARAGRYTADNQMQQHLPSLCDFFLLLQKGAVRLNWSMTQSILLAKDADVMLWGKT